MECGRQPSNAFPQTTILPFPVGLLIGCLPCSHAKSAANSGKLNFNHPGIAFVCELGIFSCVGWFDQ